MEKVLEFIKKKSLIQENDKIVIGVSGGADSIYLLRILCTLREPMNLYLEAVHVNHQIRKEAQRDQKFVENICEKLSVPCTTVCVDVKKQPWNKNLRWKKQVEIFDMIFFSRDERFWEMRKSQ